MDFYKILNEEDCHNNFQYKTGLNIDPIKFNPSGDCTSGGIYFSREDILYFLNYGQYIRKITLPEDAQIYENPGEPKKWKADKVILSEREEINLEVIKRLIDEGADPNISDSYPLRWAAEKGYTDIVKLLIPFSDSKINCNHALRSAAKNGHIDIVKLLIPVSDPKENGSYVLRCAAEYGHVDIVKLLIPVSDPSVNDSEALRCVIYNRYIVAEVVNLLMPKIDDIEILKFIEIIKLLIPVSKINNKVIKYCKSHCQDQELLDLIIVNKNTLFHNFLRSIKNKLFKIFK
ncbi:MAG: ankyrin repeat domain-containing protein [Sphaerochaetaceae bacterium]|nr:ankyrin repeat domain-containing protein [Sphaerochaetaceae bacterium]